MMEAGKDIQHFKFDRHDTFEWFLALGPLSTANARYLHGKIPTWNDFVAPPQLRSVLAQAGGRALPDSAEGPDPERRRLVGPGGFLRPAQDLRDVGEARCRAGSTRWSSGRGTMAAGVAASATASGRSSSTSPRPGSSARRSRSRFSRTISRTGRSISTRNSAAPLRRQGGRGSRAASPKSSASAPAPMLGSRTTTGRPGRRRPPALPARRRPARVRAAARADAVRSTGLR